jgi:hypothetical protein
MRQGGPERAKLRDRWARSLQRLVRYGKNAAAREGKAAS